MIFANVSFERSELFDRWPAVSVFCGNEKGFSLPLYFDFGGFGVMSSGDETDTSATSVFDDLNHVEVAVLESSLSLPYPIRRDEPITTSRLLNGRYQFICPFAHKSFLSMLLAATWYDVNVELTTFEALRASWGAALVVPAYIVWWFKPVLRSVIRPCFFHVGTKKAPVLVFGPFESALTEQRFQYRFRKALGFKRVYNKASKLHFQIS